MNYDINVKPEELENFANMMKEKVNMARSSLEVATRVINQTAESFKGSAADTLRDKYNALQHKFNGFYEAMENYSNFLTKTANTYKETNANISKAAEEVLTSDYE